MNSLTMRCLHAYNRAENTFTLSTNIILYVYKLWTAFATCALCMHLSMLFFVRFECSFAIYTQRLFNRTIGTSNPAKSQPMLQCPYIMCGPQRVVRVTISIRKETCHQLLSASIIYCVW